MTHSRTLLLLLLLLTGTTIHTALVAATPKSVAIIGAGGFIGAELFAHLKRRKNNSSFVTGFDHDPQVLLNTIENITSNKIPTQRLQTFSVVVFLGGCSGRKSCSAEVSDEQVYIRNVQSVVELAKRMTSRQTLIFASSSAVVDHNKNCAKPATEKETDCISLRRNKQLFDKYDRYTKHMVLREAALLELVTKTQSSVVPPKMVGLRFGTVGGVSRSQRVDLLTNAVVRAAYFKGTITGVGPDTNRPVLWLPDALRAIEAVVNEEENEDEDVKRFRIYHVASFNTNIGKVVTEASRITGAQIRMQSATPDASCGFALNTSRFTNDFKFTFFGNSLAVVLENIDDHVPLAITMQGTHKKKHNHDHTHAHHSNIYEHDGGGHNHHGNSMKCPVCGGHENDKHQHVLNLGSQPLANDFRMNREKALSLPRFPLRLVRCTRCHHMHLDTAYDRKILFENYLYASGTSSTLRKYFQWLASKVTNEIATTTKGEEYFHLSRQSPTVLEIASNDGTQLDAFKTLGWKTIGVDPAENLVQGAKDRGHHIVVGFWGENVDASSLPKTVCCLNAIVAQNVLAHVVSPINFLKACYNAMDENTKLYVQTSQCDMHTKAQFDTSYHEHISFFTAHSFQYAAKLSRLKIVNYEKTPIHGTSCLVTMMREKTKNVEVSGSDSGSDADSIVQEVIVHCSAHIHH